MLDAIVDQRIRKIQGYLQQWQSDKARTEAQRSLNQASPFQHCARTAFYTLLARADMLEGRYQEALVNHKLAAAELSQQNCRTERELQAVLDNLFFQMITHVHLTGRGLGHDSQVKELARQILSHDLRIERRKVATQALNDPNPLALVKLWYRV